MTQEVAGTRPWTVDEFLAWEREQEGCYEYVDGVTRMKVGDTLDHNVIAGNLIDRLRSQLGGTSCRVFALRVKVVTEGAIMYPDVVVTCTPGSGRSDIVPEPKVVVEVLSRSSQGFDRGAKLAAYQQIPSLRQYLLIAQDEIAVSLYQRDDGGWRERIVKEPEARLDFAVGGAGMTLAEIYQGATAGDPRTRQGRADV
jgi:Uma2 family endonuclease